MHQIITIERDPQVFPGISDFMVFSKEFSHNNFAMLLLDIVNWIRENSINEIVDLSIIPSEELRWIGVLSYRQRE